METGKIGKAGKEQVDVNRFRSPCTDGKGTEREGRCYMEMDG